MSSPGAGIGRDIATGDMADAQIDSFISRRHDQRVRDEGEGAAEDAWREADRRMDIRRRKELDDAWCGWHLARAECYAARAREHKAKAEKYKNHDTKENAA